MKVSLWTVTYCYQNSEGNHLLSTDGCARGYNGSQFIGTAKHLSSVLQHTDIIDENLKKRTHTWMFLPPLPFFQHTLMYVIRTCFWCCLCYRIGVPIRTEWVEVPITCLTFLGIVLNTDTMKTSIPIKCNTSLLSIPPAHWKMHINVLLFLIGKLSFTCKCFQ